MKTNSNRDVVFDPQYGDGMNADAARISPLSLIPVSGSCELNSNLVTTLLSAARVLPSRSFATARWR